MSSVKLDVILPMASEVEIASTLRLSRNDHARKYQYTLRIASVCFTALVVFLLVFAAQQSTLMPTLLPLPVGPRQPSASPVSSPSWCGYGSLPGTWVSDSRSPGQHWHILDNRCQVRDLLSSYSGSHISMVHEGREDPDLRVLDDETLEPEPLENSRKEESLANIMFIGDSVDRHILQYLCQHVGGTVRAIVLRDSLSLTESDDPCAPDLKTSQRSSLRSLSKPKDSHASTLKYTSSLTSANVSGCVVNTCSSPKGRVRLLATYIPGVHPTGPYHKGRKLSFKARIDQANKIWHSYSSSPPDLVVVSSLLWDLARLYAFEPDLFSGTELPVEWLEAWMSNFSKVVGYARETVGLKADLFLYHNAMMPRYDPLTGRMDKEYLGKATFVRQLNAAGTQVAADLGMEVLDYAALASRFMEGQTYLRDQIHPGPDVGLEVANILLNYVEQVASRKQMNQG